MEQEEVFYQAMLTRDFRFDGKFFVGVKTTGIYCRPICPARPHRENIQFFANAHLAEAAGFRPCLRCRPESAPESPAWIGKSAIVRRAVKMLHDRTLFESNEDQFAKKFGVSARHLRRVFVEEIGKTPKQLSADNRLNLARKLLSETTLPITEIVFASGFQSVRRFNDAFKLRFKKNPSEIRRTRILPEKGVTLSLSYRPPFDFGGLLHSYRAHRIGKLEWFSEQKMHRLVSFGGKVGTIVISDDPLKSSLRLEIDFPDPSYIHQIISRVRAMFDLDSDPLLIANQLESDASIKSLLQLYPGIRLSSGWDGFETAIATILGQGVSLPFARQLTADLVDLHGKDSGISGIKLFPSPKVLAGADLSSLKTTRARKTAIIALAQAIHKRSLSLEPTQDVDEFRKKIKALPGIGDWTANYIALKVLRDTNSFPDTDLVLARALSLHPKEVIEKMSPWKGYVAALFWRHYYPQAERKSA